MATTRTVAASSSSSSSTAPKPSLLRRHVLPLTIILAAAFVLRIALFTLTSLPSLLETRLELNDPPNAWKNVLKTVWAIDPPANIEVPFPYRAHGEASMTDAFATPARALPPPLLLMILSPVLPSQYHTSWRIDVATLSIDAASILFALADSLATLLVFQLAALRLRSPIVPTRTTQHKRKNRLEARHRLQSLGIKGLRLDPNPLAIAAIYAFNPLSISTCLARSGTTLVSTSLLLALWAATSGYSAITGLGIATSSLLSLHPILLAPPLIALCCRQTRYFRHHLGRRVGKRQKDSAKDWQNPTFWTGLFLAGFAWISAGFLAEHQGRPEVAAQDWYSLLAVYRSFLTLPSLTPGLSLWWYFFIEMFEHFRHFFLLVFNAHLAAWTIPVTLRFRHDPLFATFLLLGVQSIFKPYPTAGDVATWLSLGLVFPEYAACECQERLVTVIPSTVLNPFPLICAPQTCAILCLPLSSSSTPLSSSPPSLTSSLSSDQQMQTSSTRSGSCGAWAG